MTEEIEYKDYTIKISLDEYHESPREWDNLGIMTCFHSRYDLGDEQNNNTSQQWLVAMLETIIEPYHDKICGWYTNELWEWAAYNNIPDDNVIEKIWEVLDKHYIMLPLYLYEHSGITMNTKGFHCPWDSGQVGYIYVKISDVKEEWKWNRLTKKRRKFIENILKGEVETYDQYLRGEIYNYTVEDKNENLIDSCCGFYDKEYMISEAKSIIDYEHKNTYHQMELIPA